ncbi:MAG: pseudoazurin [Erythrobacter sp.]|jgi:pseudoazurin|nr:pseudoazurin [Erythrobacter sp.]
MRKTFMTALAASSLIALSACGDGADDVDTDTMAEETNVEDDTAMVEDVEPVPAVEPNGNVIEVQMYTRDPEGSGMQVFAPRVVRAQVGDTIRFVPTDPTHQSQSIDEMLPAGVEGWKGDINEAVEFVVPTPGIYGYKCNPHYAAGMVGLVIVEGEGMTDNLEAAKAVSHPGLAGREFDEIFAEADIG